MDLKLFDLPEADQKLITQHRTRLFMSGVAMSEIFYFSTGWLGLPADKVAALVDFARNYIAPEYPEQ